MSMNFSFKKNGSGTSGCPGRRKYRRQLWRRIVTTLVCIALLGTNIGETSFAAAVTAGIPVNARKATPSDAANENQRNFGADESEGLKATSSDADEDWEESLEIPLENDLLEDGATSGEATPSDAEEEDEIATSSDAELELDIDLATRSDAEAVYTLYLTHYFRFAVDGEGRNVRAEQTLELTEEDFEDGVCDLGKFAYNVPQLTVTEAKTVSEAMFDENHEGGARIVYGVNPGWRIVPVGTVGGEAGDENAAGEGSTVLREVFNGQLTDYEFIPADVVRMNVEYKYSNTGGLMGIDAADPEIVEALPVKNAAGDYDLECVLPTVEGFRIVLDPDPLNYYLVHKPSGNETQEELLEALERGDFSVDIENHEIYYYQEVSGGQIHPAYNNVYSTEYNQAWNKARTLTVEGGSGYILMAISGEANDENAGNHGANALVNPRLRVTLDEVQLSNALENGLNITINYRRNATWYTVNHWVPENLSGLTHDEIISSGRETKTENGISYVLMETEELQGRAGSLTRAAARTDGSFEMLVPLGFSQKIIENTVSIAEAVPNANMTTVDIFYKEATSYRVIFNTDYTYIRRQVIPLGGEVNFKEVATPERKGYSFVGWQYLRKDAEKDASGEYPAGAYVPVEKDGDTYKLQITADLISKEAKLQNNGGVPALYLYPIWEAGQTQITVTLWTEDLTGTDDVQAIAEGGNVETGKSPYPEKYRNYQDEPKTHTPAEGNSSLNYSNMGSFILNVDTDSPLVEYEDPANPSGSAKLLNKIQEQVNEEFKTAVRGDKIEIPIEKYYTQASFKIMHSGGDSYVNTTTADADGKTVVYVYFTRNIYTLKFHYYGKTTQGDYSIAENTNGFSYRGTQNIIDQDGNFIFDYTKSHQSSINSNKWHTNKYYAAQGIDDHTEMPVPQTITITAKYGADLREVWPAALEGQEVTIDDGGKKPADVCSWTTTSGKYRDDSLKKDSSHPDEPTIMGLYATMDEEIIAAEAIDETVSDERLKVHHLIAYWSKYGNQNSHYRYNHCYEVPGLNINSDGVERVYLVGNDDPQCTELANTLYLVPVDNEAFIKFGFNDFMEVSYNKESDKITYDTKGGYYAVRGYRKGGTGDIEYYAVARRVEAISTNIIMQQNPSARAHMVRANDNADHSTRYGEKDGSCWATPNGGNKKCGTADDPYDLYFYYDRIRYTISYMVPTTTDVGLSEIELGHIELPFGAHVTEEQYAFDLVCTDTNQQTLDGGTPKYRWTYPDGGETPVCPDRNKNGTADWKFKGWGLGPMGVNMQWEIADEGKADSPQAHVEKDFYIDSNLRLYAIWDTPTYTVTFHLNGGVVDSKGTIVQKVAANTTFNASGTIPRPVRLGYVLEGWYLSDENGTPLLDSQGKPTEFDFDSPVIRDMDVAAVWTQTATRTYTYHVYYMTEKLRDIDNGKYPETLRVNDNDIIDQANGREYYVLKKEVYEDQVYAPGTGLNMRVTDCPGYIPIEKNKILVLDKEDSYNVFFRYVPQTAGSHVVKFVVAGTETGNSPTVVKAMQVEADQTVATPGASAVAELLQKGYELVSIGDDGAYHTVTEYADLTWIDGNGSRQPMEVLAGGKIPDVIIYLVRPIDYTIKYENAGGSPEAAGNALSAVTAAEGTPVGSASGKNPTRYNTTDVFVLKNPDPVIVNGIEYRFSYWSLGNGTQVTEVTNDGTYSTLRVDPGTMGDLIFVANWTAGPKQPTPPGSGGSSGSSGSSDPPSTPTVTPSPAGPSTPTVAPSPAGPQDPSGTVPTGSPTPPIDDSPQTGDETNLALWWALMCISGIGMMAMLAMLWLLRRKKEAGER